MNRKSKLLQIREDIISDINALLVKHCPDVMDVTDCGSTPVIWPSADDQDFDTYTLDRVYAGKDNILVDSSSSNDNRTDRAEDLGTDTLVYILEFLEDNEELIWQTNVDNDESHDEENNYPQSIGFESTSPKGFTPDAQQWLRRIKDEVKISLPKKNVLRIEYPSDIVKQVRCVNVDDSIFRLDLIDPRDKFWNCNSIFPDIPADSRRLMLENWGKSVRCGRPGHLEIVYPEN